MTARGPSTPWAHFGRDRRGGVAVWFGLAAVALLFFAGSGLDLARSINQQAEIQGAADAAALAGAAAYTSVGTLLTATATATNYMNQFKAASGLSALSFTVTPGIGVVNGSATLFSMTVKASAPISNTLMAMAKSSNTVSASATAQNPVFAVTISLSNFSSSALDGDAISYFIVPTDGSVPTTTTQIFSNTNIANAVAAPSVTIQLTASQKLGFMLTNTTDGNVCALQQIALRGCSPFGYGNNGYGGAPGSVHYFYSHMSPPSKVAYPGVAQDCSLQVLASASAVPASGSCLNALPAHATVNCVQAAGLTLHYYWNDMGGPTDDRDFNDAAYTVTCSPVGATVSKGLVLTN